MRFKGHYVLLFKTLQWFPYPLEYKSKSLWSVMPPDACFPRPPSALVSLTSLQPHWFISLRVTDYARHNSHEEGLLRLGFPGPAPRICDSSGLRCDWLICISESFQVTLLLVLQDSPLKTTGGVLINQIPEGVGGMPE